MFYPRTVAEVVNLRTSCRNYEDAPLDPDTYRRLSDWISRVPPGPFGSSSRFEWVAAAGHDPSALRGLGTYGFIRGAPAFIVGAVKESEKYLEDFGFCLEHLVLQATSLGLGTCWLGGSFTRSSFARKISADPAEILPAVVAVGIPLTAPRTLDVSLRRVIGADRRLAWEKLFFDGDFTRPLSPQSAGEYAAALEMVRRGPSASNKQPWRVVRAGDGWHFYLQRTPGYRSGLIQRMLNVADIQRVDLGIAACHFDLAAAEAGLAGRWEVREPPVEIPDLLTEYVATWRPHESNGFPL